MSLFEGIEDAKISRQSNYVTDGEYVTLIRKVGYGKSRKKEDFVAIEQTVLKVVDDNDGLGHRLREDVTHMLMAKHDSFLANFKSFLSKCMDVPVDEVTQEVCEAVTLDDGTAAAQPLAGLVIRWSATTVKTKQDRDWTNVYYKGALTATEIAEVLDEEVFEQFADQIKVTD